jgi:hypothetical protein
MFSDIKTNILAIVSTMVASLAIYIIQASITANSLLVASLQILTMAILCVIIVFRIHILAMMKSPGDWRIVPTMNSKWTYVDPDTQISVAIEDELKIRQIGCLILAKAQSTRVQGAPFSTFSYKLSAVLNDEGVIDGEWKNIDPGRNYYGIFLAKLSRDGKRVDGTWLGIGTQSIKSGAWSWRAPVTT